MHLHKKFDPLLQKHLILIIVQVICNADWQKFPKARYFFTLISLIIETKFQFPCSKSFLKYVTTKILTNKQEMS